MKKILAGILAAVSMLSVSATAFATDKKVTKPGEVEYDVPVTAPTVVLELVLPSKMTAALNPYGADIKIVAGKDDVTAANGIASVAYPIINNTKDYGVYIDATATATASTGIELANKVVKAADDKKSAQLAILGIKDEPTGTDGYDTSSATKDQPADGADQGGTLMLSKDEKSVKKFIYLPANTADGETAYLAFAGELEEDVEWTEDDEIEVNLVLKITAGPKTVA